MFFYSIYFSLFTFTVCRRECNTMYGRLSVMQYPANNFVLDLNIPIHEFRAGEISIAFRKNTVCSLFSFSPVNDCAFFVWRMNKHNSDFIDEWRTAAACWCDGEVRASPFCFNVSMDFPESIVFLCRLSPHFVRLEAFRENKCVQNVGFKKWNCFLGKLTWILPTDAHSHTQANKQTNYQTSITRCFFSFLSLFRSSLLLGFLLCAISSFVFLFVRYFFFCFLMWAIVFSFSF